MSHSIPTRPPTSSMTTSCEVMSSMMTYYVIDLSCSRHQFLVAMRSPGHKTHVSALIYKGGGAWWRNITRGSLDLVITASSKMAVQSSCLTPQLWASFFDQDGRLLDEFRFRRTVFHCESLECRVLSLSYSRAVRFYFHSQSLSTYSSRRHRPKHSTRRVAVSVWILPC